MRTARGGHDRVLPRTVPPARGRGCRQGRRRHGHLCAPARPRRHRPRPRILGAPEEHGEQGRAAGVRPPGAGAGADGGDEGGFAPRGHADRPAPRQRAARPARRRPRRSRPARPAGRRCLLLLRARLPRPHLQGPRRDGDRGVAVQESVCAGPQQRNASTELRPCPGSAQRHRWCTFRPRGLPLREPIRLRSLQQRRGRGDGGRGTGRLARGGAGGGRPGGSLCGGGGGPLAASAGGRSPGPPGGVLHCGKAALRLARRPRRCLPHCGGGGAGAAGAAAAHDQHPQRARLLLLRRPAARAQALASARRPRPLRHGRQPLPYARLGSARRLRREPAGAPEASYGAEDVAPQRGVGLLPEEELLRRRRLAGAGCRGGVPLRRDRLQRRPSACCGEVQVRHAGGSGGAHGGRVPGGGGAAGAGEGPARAGAPGGAGAGRDAAHRARIQRSAPAAGGGARRLRVARLLPPPAHRGGRVRRQLRPRRYPHGARLSPPARGGPRHQRRGEQSVVYCTGPRGPGNERARQLRPPHR
mmetsp:Transcript_10394/g.42278  ORF Transcript_10394/g.42278 Transcript_10394/m.42278 type:complete len:529 (+) Transcript_10394:1171-2757(+)